MGVVFDYGIKAKKSFGQNFLVDDAALSSIAHAVSVEGQDVVEIGPGYGALTERLLSQKPRSLTLVELDSDMVAILEERLSKGEIVVPEGVAFEILKMDVLQYVPKFSKYRVIANIPYYITSPILDRFFYGLEVRPEAMVILMQQEVADRIVAKDGKESGLSLFAKNASDSVELVARVSASCFRPAPKVDSAVLRFVVSARGSIERTSVSDGAGLRTTASAGAERRGPAESEPSRSADTDVRFLKTVRAGFSSPRKKAVSNLANGLGVPKETVAELFVKLGLREDERPEKIGLSVWREITRALSA